MKIKRLLAVCLAAVLMVSAMAIPASAANTTDTYFTFNWTSSKRYDYTPTRHKDNSTPVYIKTDEYTLPYGGYYVRTLWGTVSTNASNLASAGEYWIGNYTAYTIRANGTNVSQVGKYVRIRGHYTDTTYSWGDCTIAWSPDTQGTYTSLN